MTTGMISSFSTTFIGVLVFGLVFLLFGVIGLKRNRGSRFLNYFLITIAMLILGVLTAVPFFEAENRVKKIREINAAQVESFTFKPSKNNRFNDVPMFIKDSVVVDKNRINQYCKSLNKVTELRGSERWERYAPLRCLIEIHFKDHSSLSFGFIKDNKSTILNVNSNGEFGWHFANLEANEFGEVLTNSPNK